MKRKALTIILTIALVVLNLNGIVNAVESTELEYTKSAARGNIEVYQTISLNNLNVPWTITKNTDFDLYIVVGGMSSLPVEVQFDAE